METSRNTKFFRQNTIYKIDEIRRFESASVTCCCCIHCGMHAKSLFRNDCLSEKCTIMQFMFMIQCYKYKLPYTSVSKPMKTNKFHLYLLINSLAMLLAWFKYWKLFTGSSTSIIAAFKLIKNFWYAPPFVSSKTGLHPTRKHSGDSSISSCASFFWSVTSDFSNQFFPCLFLARLFTTASNLEAMTVACLMHEEGSCKNIERLA